MPPGQAKKAERGMPPGQARKAERDMPPGQAKRYFRDEDRGRFYRHYQADAEHWRHRHRPMFAAGQYIDRSYYVRPVPQGYWEGPMPPLPPGYQYGYCRGYVMAYNPATRMIADVMDLIDTVRYR